MKSPSGVRAAHGPTSASLDAQAQLENCTRCPRLVAWRSEISAKKRAAYADQEYWGAPLPSFGDARATILLLGLAPGAHGANRTGRMFTGDSSADFLVSALHRCGLASQAHSVARTDGLVLYGARMSCAVRCVPPDNKPHRTEVETCRMWLRAELDSLASLRVVVALGSLAWDAALAVTASAPQTATARGTQPPTPRAARPRFAHAARVDRHGPQGALLLLGSYHPSQQNTFTGRLTPAMLDDVLMEARAHAGGAG